jgi:Fic family protein
MSQIIERYDAPHQFEPLLPGEPQMGPLLERASDLKRVAASLGNSTAPAAQLELRKLLRSMNSYYTNKLEGDHTRPSEIELALHDDFSQNADLARKQRLAVAHIWAEERGEAHVDTLRAQGEQQVQGEQLALKWLYSTDALRFAHGQLFVGLRQEDLLLADGSSMEPGLLRECQVAVGRHEPPTAASVGHFLARWGQYYGSVRRGEAAIVAGAASHHRLAWVHPFADGNGRTARLHTHLLFHAMGLTGGLWSPLRGFARSEGRYKALLQAADEHRRGDLDGRGNLTQTGLIEWIHYVLDVCIDQAEFMSRQLDMSQMRDRIAAALAFEESALKSGVRREALVPLHYLFVTQADLARADFKAMTGLGDRVATDTLSALVRGGFLATDSAYGKVRFAVPRHALRFYFPALWPEAEQDEDLTLVERQRSGANTAKR